MASIYNRGSKDKANWWARIKQDGKWKSYPMGKDTKTAARREADEMQERVLAGLPAVLEAPAAGAPAAALPAAPARLTVGELAEKFLKGYDRGRIKDIERYRVIAGWTIRARILPFLGHMAVAEVRRVHIATWTEQLRKIEWTEEKDGQEVVIKTGYSNAAINQARAFLSSMYRWANMMEASSTAGTRFWGPRSSRVEPLADHHFTLAEVRQLLALALLPLMARAALYLGARKGELYGLTWPCIRLDAPVPHVEIRRSYNGPTKNGKPRIVPIHAEVLPYLRQWKELCPAALHPGPRSPKHAWTGGKDELLVFPIDKGGGRWGLRGGHGRDLDDLRGVYRAAGVHVPELRPWHALRHTFTTLAIEAGVARDAVEMMLGHRSSGSAVTSGYLHAGLPYLARELEKLRLLPPAPAGVRRIEDRRRQGARPFPRSRACAAAPAP